MLNPLYDTFGLVQKKDIPKTVNLHGNMIHDDKPMGNLGTLIILGFRHTYILYTINIPPIEP
jgi:hypothetical protein